MKVQVLPDIVVNKIAAGEVVERPASVVRELCDNALDAGAHTIEVVLENGGRSLIRVTDDGSGMEQDDALLALERHATSKITTAEDLASLVTRGFRGEALPSIAAVSRVEIITRTADAPLGTHITVDAGILRSVKETTAPRGTTISVRSLFYNTPVRRKFLRSPSVEEQRVLAWLLRFAYGIPSVRLRFVSDGKELLALPAHGDFRERARALLQGDLQDVDYREDQVWVHGLVGHPGAASSSTDASVLLVNARPIVDRGIMRALKEGFQHTLKDREMPVAALSIEVDPATVDVNVHPQKAEVRFATPHLVWRAVKEGVSRAVGQFGMVSTTAPLFHLPRRMEPQAVTVHTPTAPYEWGVSPSAPRAYGPASAGSLPLGSLPLWYGNQSAAQPAETGGLARQLASVPESVPEYPRFSELRYIGQALRCYLICEHAGNLYIVDMHAAHERVNYNKLRDALRGRPIGSQQLLCPEPIAVGAVGVRRLGEQQAVLTALGFEVEPFGPAEIVVRALPPMVSPSQARAVLLDIINYYGVDDDSEVSSGAARAIVEERLDALAARMACHASVRGGDELSREEALALLASLDEQSLAGACPHGRPVIARFRKSEVEAWFGRDR